ncbi:OpgC family protein [Frigidibacter oleivorans]|uniref:OpgC family protein n=1 Tax=Frigidibacter oleivorans TaxID=2487129 RepID=UPI000F8CBF32|nr:OpgC domain-containing protein [Frigidibacter oleivorans]
MPDLPPVAPGTAPRRRDTRLDALRGLALVMIFINHVPGTVFEHWTSRNFGFSDAAEGFVLMSGLAAGIAYAPGFRAPPFWPAVTRVWGRAWTLILAHMTVTVIALGLSGLAARFLNAPEMVEINNVAPILADPVGGFIGLATLMHQLGYMNILPLYAVLLLVTPALLPLAMRWPYRLIAGSALVWLLAGSLRIAPPTYPTPSIWFFNPLSWQLLFVIGLCCGAAIRQKRRLFPARPGWLAAALAVLAAILIWTQADGLGEVLNRGMFALRDGPGPAFLFDYDKTYLSGPRLLHVLALAYALASLGAVRRLCDHRRAGWLRLLGQHGLTVFALGTVLAFAAQAVKFAAPWGGVPLDAALLVAGLGMQLAVAMVRDRAAAQRRLAPVARPAAELDGASPPPTR